jgi:hypothetical protein
MAFMGASRGAYRILLVRPEGKRLLGRHRHRERIILKWVFKKWGADKSLARL